MFWWPLWSTVLHLSLSSAYAGFLKWKNRYKVCNPGRSGTLMALLALSMSACANSLRTVSKDLLTISPRDTPISLRSRAVSWVAICIAVDFVRDITHARYILLNTFHVPFYRSKLSEPTNPYSGGGEYVGVFIGSYRYYSVSGRIFHQPEIESRYAKNA